ncbi:Vacuolar protein sorting-associated protein 41 [Coniosporium tulheliwenetii]|uniref:Vacuolar protein sorting-associated protein 41 n=1 Tax=Coniosporium tulheliwenetii TaxID=3383036 RepID=A0ACC2ZGQ5_9PEZI|nr:Vacuolar protein sorting-associated protein 41 [Cladosporium sp. JES 115]
MAAEKDEHEETAAVEHHHHHHPHHAPADPAHNGEGDEDNEDEDEEEDEEDEPKLKYTRLTGNLASVYRGGDATSAFMVAGDKMIIGTHNGNINVLSLPSFVPLKLYRAHTASVTAVSVSPLPPAPNTRPEALARTVTEAPATPVRATSANNAATASPRTPKQQPSIPATPSNSIYIATSSIDGHVCVQSLVDSKDVMLRNFARPVQTVALSPEFKSDRSYLSGGLAGSLILTTGGRAGVSANANTNSPAAAASGWLGSIGLGSNTGRDTVLHSGEGSISTIKWSLTGKYVVWVNEQGIKIMRSNIRLDSADSESAWKRIAHVDRPNRKGWEDMAGVWKARAEWINDSNLESDDEDFPASNGSPDKTAGARKGSGTTPRKGVHHRQNGLQPEVRLIDVASKLVVDEDTLTVSRFESLSGADYHLSTLYVPPVPTNITPAQRGALETIGGGLWDAGVSATRIFSSGASIISLPNSGENAKPPSPAGSASAGKASLAGRKPQEPHPATISPGLKIFIQSPYDCVLAVKRDRSDHLAWLLEHERYKDAWELIEKYPDVVSSADRDADSSPASTPSKTRQSLADFFADDAIASQTTVSATAAASRAHNSAVEKEKRRIGDLWVQQLVSAGDWAAAGKVAGRVLGTSSRWEHWVWTFAQAGKFDDITPYIPNKPLTPPLPSLVYEVVLGHYIINDRLRLRSLLEQWDPELFDIGSVINAIEDKLHAGDITENSVEGGERGRDWRILMDALAKLYLADNRPKEALRCYIRLQNADAAMSIIRDYHLLAAVADDIPGFVLLRVSREQMESAPLSELEEASSEAMRLLVDEAYQGIVRPHVVVEQLQEKGPSYQPFLFFYLRALWKGTGSETEFGRGTERIATEGKTLVEEFGDLAVELFAEYDQPLLGEFLRSSASSYDPEKAIAVCETRQYIPELVYLLSKTGQTKRALYLLTSSLSDVTAAIAFCKSQQDPDLWDDLLSYSMDKPRFIRGLLEEVGTAINPIDLVRRIPEGLEIEGLREGIGRMVREYEIQVSISEGVARVLRGEVAVRMELLRKGRVRGVKFDIVRQEPEHVDVGVENVKVPVPPPLKGTEMDEKPRKKRAEPGHCVQCDLAFAEDEKDTLIGFACGYVYHLACILPDFSPINASADDDSYGYSSRSVGPKVSHAHVIGKALKGGCPMCAEDSTEDA